MIIYCKLLFNYWTNILAIFLVSSSAWILVYDKLSAKSSQLRHVSCMLCSLTFKNTKKYEGKQKSTPSHVYVTRWYDKNDKSTPWNYRWMVRHIMILQFTFSWIFFSCVPGTATLSPRTNGDLAVPVEVNINVRM